jgi:predicted RNase H-like HicB family nuclease
LTKGRAENIIKLGLCATIFRRRSMRLYRYTVVFEQAEEDGYIVRVPALPGLITEGDSFEEARAMARDAIKGYLESLAKDGEPIPEEEIEEPLKDVVEVSLT